MFDTEPKLRTKEVLMDEFEKAQVAEKRAQASLDIATRDKKALIEEYRKLFGSFIEDDIAMLPKFDFERSRLKVLGPEELSSFADLPTEEAFAAVKKKYEQQYNFPDGDYCKRFRKFGHQLLESTSLELGDKKLVPIDVTKGVSEVPLEMITLELRDPKYFYIDINSVWDHREFGRAAEALSWNNGGLITSTVGLNRKFDPSRDRIIAFKK